MNTFTFNIDLVTDCRYVSVLSITAPQENIMFKTDSGWKLHTHVTQMLNHVLHHAPENYGYAVESGMWFRKELRDALKLDVREDSFSFLIDGIEVE